MDTPGKPTPTQGEVPEAGPSTWLTRRNLTFAAWAAVVLLVLVIGWQNWEETEFWILFAGVRMPRFLFFLVAVGLGFVLGLLTRGLWRRGR